MFDDVVVGVDDSAGGRRALALAAALVCNGGRITLVYVEVVQTKPVPELDAPSVGERQQFGLARLRRLRDASHITADVARTQAASVRLGLHDFASSRAADLIVMAASNRNGVARSQLGDDIREVLEDPPCAVAVAPHAHVERSPRMKRIGVGYDGSTSSERALAVARRVAAEHDATLVAYEAVSEPRHARVPWSVDGKVDERLSAARQRLAELGDVEAHAEFADDAVAGITHFGASVDLLILGARSNRPPGRAVHRSTSQRVADHPPSPLLVVPSRSRGGADGPEADLTESAQ